MIWVFYHVFCNEHALPIVRDQVSKLHFSGLYKRCDKIVCGLLGPNIQEIAAALRESGKKFEVHRAAAEAPSPDEDAERFTMSLIRTLVKPEDKFLYMHSKGVTKPTADHVRQWRECMEYHLMTRADECIAALDSVDVVGCFYRHWYSPITSSFDDDHFPCTEWDRGRHFSGNMWWCRGEYWLSLPEKIRPDYFGPEMHIGLGKPRFKVLFETFRDNYQNPTPLSMFVD